MSDTSQPCGVEGFARGLAKRLAARDGTGDGRDGHACFALTGRRGELADLGQALAHVDMLVVNLPIIAWKQRLAAPLLAMRQARHRGREVLLVLHEWADLDWKRRLAYLPALPLATRLLFSSPLVRAQFEAGPWQHMATSRRGLVPIPANLKRPTGHLPTDLSAWLDRARKGGTIMLGHFGAIYPKKQSTAVLDMLAALKATGAPAHAVFIGSFIGGSTVDPKVAFAARMAALGLNDRDVTITGYLDEPAVFAAIDACTACVYQLPEGLTSRRGSILAALQTLTPVIVNGPRHSSEFDHHPSFQRALASGQLHLLSPDADAATFAAAVLRAKAARPEQPAMDFDDAWADTLSSVARNPRSAARSANAVAPQAA